MTPIRGSAPMSSVSRGVSSNPRRATIRPSSPRQASSATGARTSASATTMPLLTPSSPARPTTSRAGPVVAGGDGIRFTNDGTGHGMFIGSDTTVKPF